MRHEPWAIEAQVISGPDPTRNWLWRRVRPVAATISDELALEGLTTRPPRDDDREVFVHAARELQKLQSLQTAVILAVDEVGLLEAPAGYDISHSEPRWPTTAFVSVPSEGGDVAALRLLENIVHEAMHLQLTRLEGREPLVRDGASALFSPWKGTLREAQGVLHGAYVFASLSAAFADPDLADGVGADGLEYLRRRRAEIEAEMSDVDLAGLRKGLTPAGQALLDRLQVAPS